MILQDVPTIFDTDLVRPVLAAAERLTGARFGADERSDVALRLLADHGRALTFLISDGVVPSNEGRGYVLRRLVRRAVRHAWTLGATDLVTPALVEATVEVMGEAYPAVAEAQAGHPGDRRARRGPLPAHPRGRLRPAGEGTGRPGGRQRWCRGRWPSACTTPTASRWS